MARLTTSIGHAVHGLTYVLKHERNARIHLVFAVVVVLASFLLRVATTGLAALLVAIILVFLAEIINTAFEKTLDLVEPNHHPQVKLIKDMAAGAVLVTAIAAVTLGVVIFTPLLGKIMASIIVFMGATGAGKSYIAQRLQHDYSWVHVSSGQLIRDQPKQPQEVANGQLAPTQLVERLIAESIVKVPHEVPVLLDGFPRNIDEALYLEQAVPRWKRSLDAVILLNVSREVSELRLKARGRSDDTVAASDAKWQEFQSETAPVINYYRKQGKLKEVSANETSDTVYESIKKVLKI